MKNIYYAATDTNEPALVIESDGIQYRMNSAFSPENEVGRWSAQFYNDNIQKVACLFGIGTGLFAEKLLEKLSAISKLIIYEPTREVIDFIASQKNDGDVEKRIADRIDRIIKDSRVLLCIESEDILKFRETLISNVDFYMLEGLIITKHTLYDMVYSESFERYIHTLNMNRERILVNKNTMARFRDNASYNVLTNMWIMENANLVSELVKKIPEDTSLSHLSTKFVATSSKEQLTPGSSSVLADNSVLPRDIPVIIVSAGPSLDKNVEVLRKAKGHCLILAVDTAIKYLMKRDIMPDMTITVEPIKPVEHYLDPRVEEIPAIFDSESNPEIVGKHRGRIFLYNCRDYVKRLLEAVGKKIPEDISSGGSVATAAFAILCQLEMKNIIFIGQDLAYAGENTHAGGVQSKGINNEIGHEMVEGYYGGLVRTRSDFLGYLRWFENEIKILQEKQKDIQVINATEGGAKIHGAIQMSLEEVVEKYCKDANGNYIDFNFVKRLDKLPPFLNSDEYKVFVEKRKEAKQQLIEMKDRAEIAAKLCNILSSDSDEVDADFGDEILDLSAKMCFDEEIGDSVIKRFPVEASKGSFHNESERDKLCTEPEKDKKCTDSEPEKICTEPERNKLNNESERDKLHKEIEMAGFLVEAENYCRKTRIFCESALAYPLINNYAVSEIADEVSRLRLQGGTEEQIKKNKYKQEQLAFEAIAKACKNFVNYADRDHIN